MEPQIVLIRYLCDFQNGIDRPRVGGACRGNGQPGFQSLISIRFDHLLQCNDIHAMALVHWHQAFMDIF